MLLGNSRPVPLVLTADEAEKVKVIVWSTSPPGAPRVHERLRALLSEEDYSSVARVQIQGRGCRRRVEILCWTGEARKRILDRVRRHGLGLENERVVRGRTLAQRRQARSSRPVPRQRTPLSQSSLATGPIFNRFHPLEPLDGLSLEEWSEDDVETPNPPHTVPHSLTTSVDCEARRARGLHLATLNVNGEWTLAPTWGSALRKQRIDLVGVTETYLRSDSPRVVIPGYRLLGRNMEDGASRGVRVPQDNHGIGMLVSTALSKLLCPLEKQPTFRDAFWLRMSRRAVLRWTCGEKRHRRAETVEGGPRTDLWIGVYYLSPSLPQEALQKALDEAVSFVDLAHSQGASVVLMGDLNANLRHDGDPLRRSPLNVRERSMRSSLLSRRFSSLHTLRPQHCTFTHHRRGQGKSMVDYILAPPDSLSSWGRPRVHQSMDLASDHWMLSAWWRDFFVGEPLHGNALSQTGTERRQPTSSIGVTPATNQRRPHSRGAVGANVERCDDSTGVRPEPSERSPLPSVEEVSSAAPCTGSLGVTSAMNQCDPLSEEASSHVDPLSRDSHNHDEDELEELSLCFSQFSLSDASVASADLTTSDQPAGATGPVPEAAEAEDQAVAGVATAPRVAVTHAACASSGETLLMPRAHGRRASGEREAPCLTPGHHGPSDNSLWTEHSQLTHTTRSLGDDREASHPTRTPRWRRRCRNDSGQSASASSSERLRGLARELADATSTLTPSDVERSYAEWETALGEHLTAAYGTLPQRRRGAPPLPWFNQEVKRVVSLRRKAWQKVRGCVTAHAGEEAVERRWKEYLVAKRAARDAVSKARIASWREAVDKLGDPDLSASDKAHLLRRLSRTARPPPRWGAMKGEDDRLVTPAEPSYLELWAIHYERLGQDTLDAEDPSIAAFHREVEAECESIDGHRVSEEELREEAAPSEDALLHGDMTADELEAARDELKTGKAPGIDSIANEHLRDLPVDSILPMFNLIWQQGKVPSRWNTGIIVPLPKSDDASSLDQTRGITLMSCVCKLFGKVLERRLWKFVEGKELLCSEQGGFRKGRECMGHATVLYETLWRRNREGKPTFVGFVDFSKAFDRVWRNGLFVKLHRKGIRGRMLSMLRALYAESWARVQVNDEFTRPFRVKSGVKQGDVLSPLLFLIFIDDLLKELKDSGIGLRVPGVKRDTPFTALALLAALGWADDLVLLAASPEKLQRGLDIVHRWSQRWKMLVNADKTKVMIIESGTTRRSDCRDEARNASPSWTIGGRRVSLVDHYRYLGITFSSDLSWDREVLLRARKAEKLTHAWTRVLRNPHIPPAVRRGVVLTYIVPAVSYGIGLWGQNQPLCAKVETALAPAWRMTLWASKAVRCEALQWELGVPPLRLLAIKEASRLLMKWLNPGVDVAQSSLVWPRRLFSSRQFSQWGWCSRTVKAAQKDLGYPKDAVTRDGRGLSRREQRDKFGRAALSWYRQFFRGLGSSASRLILELHEEDGALEPQPYVHSTKGGFGVAVLLKLRTGAMRLNNVVHKFANRLPGCPAVASGSCECDSESPEHFFCECREYSSFRRRWIAPYSSQLSLSILNSAGSLVSFRAALEGSPALLVPEDDKAISHELVVKFESDRTACLADMWTRRMHLLRADEDTSARANPSRVDASSMTDNNDVTESP